MTRLTPFRFPLTNGQEAVFYAPTYAQAEELALTWRRARGLAPVDHERDRVAWNLPKTTPNDMEPLPLDPAA